MGLSRWLEAAGIDPGMFRRVAAARFSRGKNFGEPRRVRSDPPAEREDSPSATLDPGGLSPESDENTGDDGSRLVWFSVYERARPVLDQISRLPLGAHHAASTARCAS